MNLQKKYSIGRISYMIKQKKWKYLFFGSKVTIETGGILSIGKNVKIKNSNIYIKKGDHLIIGDNVLIKNCKISTIIGSKSKILIGHDCNLDTFNIGITGGLIEIGHHNFMQGGIQANIPYFEIKGDLMIGNYNRIRCDIWTRFNSKVRIGSHNAINEGTEIRSDDSIIIGDYNQISYNCIIWDTNTHNLYKAEKRRTITDNQFPDFGLEYEKPKTQPIIIGNDCWLGRDVSILKGTKIKDKCVLGYGALLSNVTIEENKTVINQPSLKIVDNKL